MLVKDRLVSAIYALVGEKGFHWDKAAGRYRDRSTGRFIAEKTVLNLGERYADDVLRPTLQRLTERFIAGDIELAVWQERMAKELKDAYIIEAQLGRGGARMMTPADYGRIGGRLNFEYRHLDNFAQEIKLGMLSDKQIAMRVDMYVNGARSSYFDGLQSSMKESEYTQERRVLSPAEHCDDCVSYAAEGWQVIGYFPPPGIGSVCAHNCHCYMEFR